MAKYIDPTYDVGFKLTFGRENLSEELLMGILNALLCENDDFEEITSVKYMNNERISDYKMAKVSGMTSCARPLPITVLSWRCRRLIRPIS